MTLSQEAIADLRVLPLDSSDGSEIGAAYWRSHAQRGGPLKPLRKPCHDCAVVEGFYKDFSDELARQPFGIIAAVCGNWFCHNHANRACAGNIANVAALLAQHQQASGERSA